ncbi:MAG: SPFH domain-containing protein [Oscillospiraceae bacterium]|nr:SPFH domain-containing protein [Oscillospiraceae bacterium]
MGLIRAAAGAIGSTLADQWRDYFYCESLPANVMAIKATRRVAPNSSNKGNDNIITTGSVIAVADGQCMMVVEQGKILDVCFEPGEYYFDAGGTPSLFTGGSLSENAIASLKTVWERFKLGGSPGMDTRVYYFNTKELIGNKYGTPNPVPFRVVDKNIGLDMDIAIRCFGEFSYKISNPMLFYVNVCGNVPTAYVRETIDGQLRSEIMTALQPAFARISEMGIRYSALPGHAMELSEAINDVLSSRWRDSRGLEVVSFGVSTVNASKEDEDMIKQLQKSAALRDPSMAAAKLVQAKADAMRAAASNENAGPMMAFAGMNMAAGAGGINAQDLFAMGQQQVQAQSGVATWNCDCGQTGVTSRFCSECGKAQPITTTVTGWNCTCGNSNATGRFCSECGNARPEGAKCEKCGWEAPDSAQPPRFCSECGAQFNIEE